MPYRDRTNGDSPETLRQRTSRTRRPIGPRYKWVALTNTTIGVLMASIDASIVLISLPAIFNGIGVNPLAPGETNYFLWMLLGYMVVTATLLVTFGRISDMFGRVKFYNLGFLIFTIGSTMLWLTPGRGNTGALELIIFRLIQGVGSGFLWANSTAIITDAFPADQRGFAMGINQIAAILGSVIGLILGGVLAYFSWRLVFLVSVPVGIVGTIWAYLMLRETATIRKHQKLDIPGNITFAVGATTLLLGITYGIEPYGNSPTGWSNPLVIGAIVLGPLLLGAFIWLELHVEDPMFRLNLFRIRMFAAGNTSSFLASIARGGLQFMLIIWLQGIWLPLHGYDYAVTPLWAGIYMLPLLVGFILMGPMSGYLSDRFGARVFSTTGMTIQAVCFLLLTFLPANFSLPGFRHPVVRAGSGSGHVLRAKHDRYYEQRACRSARRGFRNARDLPEFGVAGQYRRVLQHHHRWPGGGAADIALYRTAASGAAGSHSAQHRQLAAHSGALRGLPGLQPDGDADPGSRAARAARGQPGGSAGEEFLPDADLAAVHAWPARRLLPIGDPVPGRRLRLAAARATLHQRASETFG